jgi:VanZ family protein
VKKLFFLCVFVIVYFTLYPWTFVPFHGHSTILEGVQPLVGKRDYLDMVVNLCFYLPLGVLGALGWWKGSSTAGRWVALAAFGAALSFTLETIQAWVPGRDSSLLDILTNTIGTIAGARLGVAIAKRLPSDPRWRLASPRWPMPAVLIAAWLLSQWFPFLPILHISLFSESLHALMRVSSLGWIDLADAFVAALLIGSLLREALTSSAYRLALAGACLALPARLFIVVGAAPWPLAVAFAVGLLVSDLALARWHAGTRLLAAAAVLLIAVRELDPFHFADTAGPFYWIPFNAFLEATRDSAIRVTSGKFFLYGATVWMVREAGVSLGIAASGVGGLLIAGECAQRYLPGRVAESTDPILAVIAACVIVWLKDRPPAPARLPAGHVREHDRPDNRRV